jgi:hypothetical protein
MHQLSWLAQEFFISFSSGLLPSKVVKKPFLALGWELCNQLRGLLRLFQPHPSYLRFLKLTADGI